MNHLRTLKKKKADLLATKEKQEQKQADHLQKANEAAEKIKQTDIQIKLIEWEMQSEILVSKNMTLEDLERLPAKEERKEKEHVSTDQPEQGRE